MSNGNDLSGWNDLDKVDWNNDQLFFSYECSCESSQFDPKARWVPGAEYYERVYSVRVPVAFRNCETLTIQFIEWMEDNHPEAEGFYVK